MLEVLAAGARLEPDEVDLLAGAASAEALVREAVLDELGRDAPPCPHTFTVAVCTRDRADLLLRCLRCLRSVEASVDPSGLPRPDVLVVDNAPPDDKTRAAVAGRPGVRYAVEPRAGLDFARNLALRTARGDVVAFLDDDVVVDPGWYAALSEVWAVHADAGGVTGQVLPFELETPAQIAFEQYGGFRRPWTSTPYTGPVLAGNPLYPYGAGMFGAGCNMSYRQEVVTAMGGFDEALDTGRPLPGAVTSTCSPGSCARGTPSSTPPLAWCTTSTAAPTPSPRQLYTWGTGHMAYVEKTWRADPASRRLLVRLVAWQLRRLTRQTAKSVLGRSRQPYALSLAELRGGLVGLSGTYARSARRSRAVDAATRA